MRGGTASVGGGIASTGTRVASDKGWSICGRAWGSICGRGGPMAMALHYSPSFSHGPLEKLLLIPGVEVKGMKARVEVKEIWKNRKCGTACHNHVVNSKPGISYCNL